MSTSIIDIRPEDLNSVRNRRKHHISIIGCGRISTFHAYLFLKAGFRVTCIGRNQATVEQLVKGDMPFLKHESVLFLRKNLKVGHLEVTTNLEEAVSKSDVVIIPTELKIDEKRKVDHLDTERNCRRVGSALKRGSLIIIIGLMTPEGLIEDSLESSSGFIVGTHFGLAYSPIRRIEKKSLDKLSKSRRIVAAQDNRSLKAASTILDLITEDSVIETDNFRNAQIATIFEAVQQYTNKALSNEFASLCEKIGIDYLQTLKLLAKVSDETIVSPALSQNNISEETQLLLREAEDANVRLRILGSTTDVNKESLKHAVTLIREALKSCGKSLRRARIVLLGVSSTRDRRDAPKNSAKRLLEILRKRGCKVSLYDPYFTEKMLTELGFEVKKRLGDAAEGMDCIVILTGHTRFQRLSFKRLRILAKMPAAIVDLEGVLDPEKVEKKGFVYRGLGRGVWTK